MRFIKSTILQWSGLTYPLRPNVHMLTLEQWGGPVFDPTPTQPYLLRLEHIYEKGEDPDLSKPATVSLQVSRMFTCSHLGPVVQN